MEKEGWRVTVGKIAGEREREGELYKCEDGLRKGSSERINEEQERGDLTDEAERE